MDKLIIETLNQNIRNILQAQKSNDANNNLLTLQNSERQTWGAFLDELDETINNLRKLSRKEAMDDAQYFIIIKKTFMTLREKNDQEALYRFTLNPEFFVSVIEGGKATNYEKKNFSKELKYYLDKINSKPKKHNTSDDIIFNTASASTSSVVSTIDKLMKPLTRVRSLWIDKKFGMAVFALGTGIISAAAGAILLSAALPGLLLAGIIGGIAGAYLGLSASEAMNDMILGRESQSTFDNIDFLSQDILDKTLEQSFYNVNNIIPSLKILDSLSNNLGTELKNYFEYRIGVLSAKNINIAHIDAKEQNILARNVVVLKTNIKAFQKILEEIQGKNGEFSNIDISKIKRSLRGIIEQEQKAIVVEKNIEINIKHEFKNAFNFKYNTEFDGSYLDQINLVNNLQQSLDTLDIKKNSNRKKSN